MPSGVLQLLSRAAAHDNSSSSSNAYLVAGDVLYSRLYPPVGDGFKHRIAAFHALSGFAILSCIVYVILLYVRKEGRGRVNWWFCRIVARPEGRTVVFNIRMACVVVCLMASLVIFTFGISYAKVYLLHQAQAPFNQWRSLAWLPLTIQGYFISRSSLHAFLICLADLNLFSMPRLVIYLFSGIAAVLTLAAIACSVCMAFDGSRLWYGTSGLLDFLTELAAAEEVSAAQFLELSTRTEAVDRLQRSYHNLAIAVYAVVTAILILLIAVNAGSWALCRLMQARISAAEARLAAARDPAAAYHDPPPTPTSSDELEFGWDGPSKLPAKLTATTLVLISPSRKVSRRQLLRMTQAPDDDQGADGAAREGAEAVLAMKKALFDLRVISAVVGLSSVAQLGVFVFILVFVINDWILTRPFGYNEAATLGALWVNLVAVSGGMVFLIFSELRYRSPAGAGLDPAAAGAEMAALSPGL